MDDITQFCFWLVSGTVLIYCLLSYFDVWSCKLCDSIKGDSRHYTTLEAVNSNYVCVVCGKEWHQHVDY